MTKPVVSFQVNDNIFEWNQENGLFTFDGASTLLFWDSAIELFLKTIEEVSGKDVSQTVYQVTGYRMGSLVTSYYSGRKGIDHLYSEYSNIYRNAGWGNYEVIHLSLEDQTAVVRLTNSWEHRILKGEKGSLLPSHWAGIFSGIFKRDMWYKVTSSSVTDEKLMEEIEIFPTSFTVTDNIHDLARRKERESIQELENLVNNRTEELSSMIKELSTPVIPVLNDILVIPLIGKFNEERLADLIEKALYELMRQKARFMLIDMTGLKNVDDHILEGIIQVIQAIKLLGADGYLVGISPDVTLQIVKSAINLDDTKSFSSLQKGVEYAVKQNGYELVKK
ncbi:STAS domain-containing protein [Fictibacillus fluitans]|uniref:STAS domain-containing protein n=1 Tax=Fictibacillus fluitans TaxID=3058422 RepID=A0ABT8HYQ1_9BACL|nr:STAS domain-containing protein [Fictibacillus sp. NE201]MDN4525910.1 STAS domain-containing protein [Fictibacillus sp. NE201]